MPLTPDEKNPQIRVSESAGPLDTLYALGRMLTIIAAAVPILLQLFGARDLIGFIAYMQSEDGARLGAALAGLVAFGWALVKTFRRGAQVATVAAHEDVPNNVAKLK